MRCPHYPERGGAGDFVSAGADGDVRCRPMSPSPTLDVAFVRRQFPALTSSTVFFDNAGGSQILGRVVDRIADYLLTTNVQHGATYAVSQAATARVADAQVRTAALLNAASADEIVMGPTSTVLLQWLARAMSSSLGRGDEVVVSRADHESNIGPWVALAAQGVTVRTWELRPGAHLLHLDDLAALLTPRTRLVAVTQASNIFGAVQPVADIARLVHAHGARLCVDGVAFAPHRAVDVQAWDVDYYVLSFYKVFGPHHAVLYGKRALLLGLDTLYHYFVPKDRIPYKLQPGNPNYELSYGCVGIVDYLEELGRRHGAGNSATPRQAIETAWTVIANHEAALATRLLEYLRQHPRVRLLGPESGDAAVRVPTVSFVVDGVDARDIVAHTDALGIGIRHGDFHSRRLVEWLGHGGPAGVVRASMAHYNTVAEVDRLAAALDAVIR
jgi:cysteine desulfurase family protein (TIGR01976 family)